jgi:pimeloyl-ACP methyl ester carboxylesterase
LVSIAFLFVFVSLFVAPVKAEELAPLVLKSGSSLKVVSVLVEGDFLMATLESGSVKLPKSTLGDDSLKLYFPDSIPAAKEEIVSAELTQTASAPNPTEPSSAFGVSGDRTTDSIVAISSGNDRADKLLLRLPPMPTLDKSPKFTAEKVEFEVRSRIPGTERVKVQALVPKDTDGKTPASASDIVFYAPYINYTKFHEKRDAQDTRIFWELCEVYGMTVFTAEFGRPKDFDDRKTCYYYPESGSFQVVFEARDRLIREQKLNRRRMFVIGNSGGSSMAQRMGLLYPNDIAAVAMFGGGRFDPVERKVDLPWLILNTRGDPRAPQNVTLAEQLRGKGANALYAETEPASTIKEDFLKPKDENFHHSASDLGFELMQQFIVGVVEINRTTARIADWPFKALIQQPFKVERADEGKGATRELLRFPSEQFAILWQNCPYRIHHIPDPANPELMLTVLVRYPKGENKGWIIYSGGTATETRADGDFLDYLALDGYATVTAHFSKSERTAVAQAGALTNWAFSGLEKESSPVALLGKGSGGRHLALASATIRSAAIKHDLIVVDSELYWPFSELSAVERAGKIRAERMYLVGDTAERNYMAFLSEVRTASSLLVVKKVESLSTVLEYKNQ